MTGSYDTLKYPRKLGVWCSKLSNRRGNDASPKTSINDSRRRVDKKLETFDTTALVARMSRVLIFRSSQADGERLLHSFKTESQLLMSSISTVSSPRDISERTLKERLKAEDDRRWKYCDLFFDSHTNHARPEPSGLSVVLVFAYRLGNGCPCEMRWTHASRQCVVFLVYVLGSRKKRQGWNVAARASVGRLTGKFRQCLLLALYRLCAPSKSASIQAPSTKIKQ